MSENLSKPEFAEHYDNGPGSEAFKRKAAESARANPVMPAICIGCEKVAKLQAENERLKLVIVDVHDLSYPGLAKPRKAVRNE